MYLSPEVHDALCEAGAWSIGIMLGTFAVAAVLPWLWRKTRFARKMMRVRFNLWVKYRRDLAVIRRDARRYRAAMRVFDKPVRWEEK